MRINTLIGPDIFRKLLGVCLMIWLVLWAVFFFAENKKGDYREFFALANKDLEGKRIYLMGQDFYEFVNFCRSTVPPGSTYEFAGMRLYAIEEVRAIYYLWPLRAVTSDNEYYFVYGDFEVPDMSDFEKVAEFKDKAYIMKRRM
ncbi:MAG: hypothetical protein PHP46_05555 [Candidatus Omnitrophica bacterium]|jgi:hypothetical protein|nr:hypothetical protein [Candidatus Omnitrophota bacterium]